MNVLLVNYINLKLPLLAQFALGTAVLGAVVVEVLAAAGMLGGSAD